MNELIEAIKRNDYTAIIEVGETYNIEDIIIKAKIVAQYEDVVEYLENYRTKNLVGF